MQTCHFTRKGKLIANKMRAYQWSWTEVDGQE